MYITKRNTKYYYRRKTPQILIPILNTASNPIKWGQYTLIISRAEKKFVDIYNFQTPEEHKILISITPLAHALLFEEVRLQRLSPIEFIELLVGFGGKDTFKILIKSIGNYGFDFEAYRQMYSLYIDFRAREIRPIVKK